MGMGAELTGMGAEISVLTLLPPLLPHFADFGHGVEDAQAFFQLLDD